MGKSYRPGRLGEEIRRIVSNMLLMDIKDPRLQNKMISITGVDVTSDGSYATCYVTVMSNHADDSSEKDEENKEVLEGLKSASGLMRKEIGRQVKVRHTPGLIFKIDSSLAYGRKIEKVIKDLDIRPEPKMVSLDEIADALEDAETIMLYPHVNMDGDALGSCVALALGLESIGKTCKIVLSERIPDNLQFMEHGLTITDLSEGMNADIAVLIDCGELKRIPRREEVFNSAKRTICIDHHGTTEAFCELNYIDPNRAATGQIIYELLEGLEIIDPNGETDSETLKEMGEALFAAITTDTGDFQYSNTQKESHEIVAKLYDLGIDHNKVSREIYESNRIERLKLTSKAISNMELFADGKAAIAEISQDMLKETGARMEESEWIAGELRSIKGVEVAILLKEEEEKVIKCSLRSKYYFDVASLAARFDGGGHVRASGYTAYKTLSEARKEIIEAVDSALQNEDR